uniref:ATP synthase F0 subunit 8 n=1 Tax=Nymphon australe TaxID=136201 RepID=UPI00226CAC3F|nr:ATP synthase F0 subunit 8 [Nymphon australe]UZA61082.1 ATP synthase F0 subunit 8 [Nymphon australe]
MNYISNIYFPALMFIPLTFYFLASLFNFSKIFKTKNMMSKIKSTEKMMLMW